jgi:hypothetical protein
MIRRAIRWSLVGVTILLGLATAFVAYFSYTRFLRYQPAVDRLYAGLSPEDRTLSGPARRVFETIEPDSMRTYDISKSLLFQVAPSPVRMGEWHLRNTLWVWLLPRRFDPEKRLLLFAHFLPLEGGSGVGYGAHKYFGKSPNQLSETEALQLLTIARSPAAYSPTGHPDRFRDRLKVLSERYRASV